jgi:hypothetical protein
MNFTQKNQNRRKAFKAAREENRGQALHARSLRRMIGGAFGREDAALHNQLVFGTTGTPKSKGEQS